MVDMVDWYWDLDLELSVLELDSVESFPDDDFSVAIAPDFCPDGVVPLLSFVSLGTSAVLEDELEPSLFGLFWS